MKLSRNSGHAFTLIELLTVIAIIAILMGLLFPVIGTVKDKARGVDASNMTRQLVTSIKNYYTEYGTYPVTTGLNNADFFAGQDGNQTNLMKVLRATPTTDAMVTKYNPRLISYIDVQDARDTNPATAISGLDSATNLHDPWGGVYRIEIDGNYDNAIKNPYTSGAGSVPNLTLGVIAWSLGKDGDGAKTQTGGAKTVSPYLDDIVSWQ
jgi:prepilin-type N-terminal cleavage/methylation domain-containing protein